MREVLGYAPIHGSVMVTGLLSTFVTILDANGRVSAQQLALFPVKET